jgi:hypothetical protein
MDGWKGVRLAAAECAGREPAATRHLPPCTAHGPKAKREKNKTKQNKKRKTVDRRKKEVCPLPHHSRCSTLRTRTRTRIQTRDPQYMVVEIATQLGSAPKTLQLTHDGRTRRTRRTDDGRSPPLSSIRSVSTHCHVHAFSCSHIQSSPFQPTPRAAGSDAGRGVAKMRFHRRGRKT